MADFAAMLTEKALNAEGPDIAGAYQRGAALALEREKLIASRNELEQKALSLDVTKNKQLLSTVAQLNRAKDPATRRLLAKVLENKSKMYGKDNIYTPEYISALQNSEEIRNKTLGLEMQLTEQVSKGEITLAEANKRFQEATGDLEFLVQMDTDRIYQASQFSTDNEGKARRAKMLAETRAAESQLTFERVGPKELARKTTQDFNKFRSSGGMSSAISKLKKMKSAVEAFESGKIKSGGLGGVAKLAAGAVGVQGTIAPKFKEASDAIRSSLNLKASLDSQFSAKEAEQQYSMKTVDPTLKPEQNARRARAILEESKMEFTEKINAFREQGYDVSAFEREYAKIFGERPSEIAPGDGQGKSGQGVTDSPAVIALQNKLDNPNIREQLAKGLAAKPDAIPEAAIRFGYDEKTFRRILGLPQAGGQ